MDPARLPPHRVTVEFVFNRRGTQPRWLVPDGAHSSLRMEPPGHEADLGARGSAAAWLAVSFGHRTYAEVVAAGDLVLHGPAHLVTHVADWFDPSPFAAAVAAQRPAP